MDFPVNTVHVGRLNRSPTQNDAKATQARAIRGVMIQKREAVKRIEDEIAQLVENKRGLEEDLVRLGTVLAPHNDGLLPNEVLSHIFMLLALGYGTVTFPIPKNNAPPQLVVSHVCSHWRRVALHTPELWSDTYLIFPTNIYHRNHYIYFHQRWVFRARTSLVTLSIRFDESSPNNELASALQNILLPIQVKRLRLRLTYKQLMALLTLPEAALSGLSEFEVELRFPDRNMDINMSDPHSLITRLRSVTFRAGAEDWIDRLRPSLPWGQLRSLKFEIYMGNQEGLIMDILREIPMLEALSLQIFGIGMWEQLTMPSLRNLTMQLISGMVTNGMDIDNMLRKFLCPALTQFALIFHGSWTCETFEILKQQYNMQELRELKIFGTFALPISSILRDAPMLHSLSLRQNPMMDEEALIGVANGTLGQFLRGLEIDMPYDAREVLDMVEARKKTVDGLIKNGCSWREEITSLKDVVIHTTDGKDYKERIIALEEAGIHVTI
jgi:hypothetical protein